MKSLILCMGFAILSVLAVSCQSDESDKSDKSDKSEKKDSIFSQKSEKPESVQDAFESVLKVLHDPLEKDHCFFKTDFPDLEDGKKSQKFYVKNAKKEGGKGSYNITVQPKKGSKTGTGNIEDKITYVYDNFRPSKSKIMVNGSLRGTHWDRESGVLQIKTGDKLVVSGLFNAEIEFVIDKTSQPFEITNGSKDAGCASKNSITKGKMMFVYTDLDTDNSIQFDSSCGCGDQARLERLLKVIKE